MKTASVYHIDKELSSLISKKNSVANCAPSSIKNPASTRSLALMTIAPAVPREMVLPTDSLRDRLDMRPHT